MVFAALGDFADGGRRHAYTIFYAAFPCPLLPVGPLCTCRRGATSGVRKYETVSRLHCFCRNRPSNRLRHRSGCRDVVPGNKSAGVPQLLLLRALGRVAARGEGRLTSSSKLTRLLKEPRARPAGFLHSTIRVRMEGGCHDRPPLYRPAV